METTVFLIRHGVTQWHREGRVLGQRDIDLSAEGVEQAHTASALLAEVPMVDLISSPLQRAVQTAEIIGEHHGISVARDPRLIDLDVGHWAGKTYAEVFASPEYQRFIANPTAVGIPSGDSLADVRTRAVAALEQALEDSPSGSALGLVSHAGVIRILLAHYLGSPPANYHRIRVAPGSVSVLSFADDRDLPRVLAVNCVAKLALAIGRAG